MKATISVKFQTRAALQLVCGSRLLEGTLSQVAEEVAREVADNPALEVVGSLERWLRSDDYHSRPVLRRELGGGRAYGSRASLDELAERVAERQPVLAGLEAQLRLLVESSDWPAAQRLLHSLDERGYLPCDLPELAEKLNIDRPALDRLVRALHELEPSGIGARDARECFLLQCDDLESQENAPGQAAAAATARRLITLAWDDLMHQHLPQAARKSGLSLEAVRDAVRFMVENFQPNPLAAVSGQEEESGHLGPADMIVVIADNLSQPALRLEIPGEEACALRVSAIFERALQRSASGTASGQLTADERGWVRGQVERARVFAAALRQRWVLLRRVGEYLLERQAAFFAGGPGDLKPLTRQEVAEALGLHESTVSRAVQGKTMQLPGGRRMPLSDLFDASIPVKEAIREMLARSDAPVSDREIAERLQTRGWQVARRTVAKYREQMDIPTSHMRERAARA